MNSKQQGFTLIELVVVIVILGILAAVAVPKFVSMQGDARLSVVQGVAASMRSTSAMIHAKALASGATTSLPAGSVEGISTQIALVNGYPSVSEIIGLLDLQGSNFNVGTAGRVQVTGGTNAATCQVTYANATLDTATNTVTPPVITITNNTAAGCN